MGKALGLLLLLAFVFAVQTRGAKAEERIALVIGNSGYQSVGELRNPINDARLMARTLRGVGFRVIERLDADQRRMKIAIKEFGQTLRNAGPTAVGLFYYAGHGVQIGGVNYLIPINVNILDEADADIEAVSADAILAQMESAGNRMNIVIMDACRNNPFRRSFRSASLGLARMSASRGTLIAYATAPGDVAADGDDLNSPYTKALATAIQQPGLVIEQVFKDVRNRVIEATGGRQVPWEASSLTGGNFYFQPAVGTAAAPAAPPPQPVQPSPQVDQEAAFWASIRDQSDPLLFAAYVSRFPNGRYVGSARARIEELTGASTQQLARLPKEEPPPPPQRSPVLQAGPLQVKPNSRSDCGFVRSTGTVSADARRFQITFRDGVRQKVTISGAVSPAGDISETVKFFIGGETIHENAPGRGKLKAQFVNGEFSGSMTLTADNRYGTVCTIDLYAKARN